MKLPKDGSVQQAIKSFQKGENGANSFIVFGYEGKNTLKVVKCDEGGVAETKQYFPTAECRYALIRKEWKVEMANTVKFAFISWTPRGIKPMRKAMLSIHRGQIKDILSPTHVQLEAEQLSEVSDKEIDDKFGFSSGTAVHVSEKKIETTHTPLIKRGSITRGESSRLLFKKAQAGYSPVTKSSERRKSVKALKFSDGDNIAKALSAVKSDSDEINWMLAVYDDIKNNIKSIKLLNQGSGGVQEMLSNLDSDNVYYGYFRVIEKYDQSTTVKFGYLKLMSQKVSPLKRAKISTHRGFITGLFQPSHVEFDIGDLSEINEKDIMLKFGKTTGTVSNVTDKAETLMASKMVEHKKVDHLVTVKSDTKMKFDDEEAFKAAIQDVRDDSNDTMWMLGSYVKKNQLGLIGRGEGDLSELLDSLEEKSVNFGLYRVVETIDKSNTVKFVFIKWQPRNVNSKLKGEIATLKGAITPLFSPWHVDFFCETKDEISEEIIKKQVSAVAGTLDRTNE